MRASLIIIGLMLSGAAHARGFAISLSSPSDNVAEAHFAHAELERLAASLTEELLEKARAKKGAEELFAARPAGAFHITVQVKRERMREFLQGDRSAAQPALLKALHGAQLCDEERPRS
jgi:hypothetical protein